MSLQQLSSRENCLTNSVMKKPRFAQSFSTTWTTLQGPKSLLNLMPKQKHQWNGSALHPGYSEHILFSCSLSPDLTFAVSTQECGATLDQISLVEWPWHQSCGSGPCEVPTAQTVSLQLLHRVPVGCKYSWMITITEKILLVHSEEHSKGFQPEGSWTATPLKSPWVSQGHSWE